MSSIEIQNKLLSLRTEMSQIPTEQTTSSYAKELALKVRSLEALLKDVLKC